MKKKKQNNPLVRLQVVCWAFAGVAAVSINIGAQQNKCTAACQKETVIPGIKKSIPVVNPLGILWTKFL